MAGNNNGRLTNAIGESLSPAAIKLTVPFAAILPETGAHGATIIAERICRAIGGGPLEIADGRRIDVTVSIGAATFPAEAETEVDLIAAADAALYDAKETGRNRVAVSGTATRA